MKDDSRACSSGGWARGPRGHVSVQTGRQTGGQGPGWRLWVGASVRRSQVPPGNRLSRAPAVAWSPSKGPPLGVPPLHPETSLGDVGGFQGTLPSENSERKGGGRRHERRQIPNLVLNQVSGPPAVSLGLAFPPGRRGSRVPTPQEQRSLSDRGDVGYSKAEGAWGEQETPFRPPSLDKAPSKLPGPRGSGVSRVLCGDTSGGEDGCPSGSCWDRRPCGSLLCPGPGSWQRGAVPSAP